MMAEDEETTTARYIASNISTHLMLKTLFEMIATMADDPDRYRSSMRKKLLELADNMPLTPMAAAREKKVRGFVKDTVGNLLMNQRPTNSPLPPGQMLLRRWSHRTRSESLAFELEKGVLGHVARDRTTIAQHCDHRSGARTSSSRGRGRRVERAPSAVLERIYPRTRRQSLRRLPLAPAARSSPYLSQEFPKDRPI
jgi:hypothetical protein